MMTSAQQAAAVKINAIPKSVEVGVEVVVNLRNIKIHVFIKCKNLLWVQLSLMEFIASLPAPTPSKRG